MIGVRLFAVLLSLQVGGQYPERPLERSAREILHKFGVTVLYRAEDLSPLFNGTSIKGLAAPMKDLRSYAPILLQEWSPYPRELVERTKLKRIILCSELTYGGQRRTAIPDLGKDDLYLDVTRGREHELYVRKVIHHEYFHIIDWRDDGKLYQDTDWIRLNPTGFKYGRGGAALQDDPSVSLPNDSTAGFVNRYAASGVEEDKAETFCFLVVTPDAMESRLKTDRILQSKVAKMKELLIRFSGAADQVFWDNARKLREKKPQE